MRNGNVISATVVLFAVLNLFAGQPPSAGDAGQLFLQRVQPLLKEKCLACHGDDLKKLKAKLDLRTRDGLLKGGESKEPALVPGDPAKSRMYVGVTRREKDFAMPPKENDKLSDEQVEWIRQWIAAGAPWPDASKLAANPKWDANYADGVIVKTSGGRSPEWTNRRYKPEDLWAYRPIKHPPVPQIPNPQSPIPNPVDAFIQQKLSAKGFAPAQRADKLTLIRRATFDLTGLPPTPEEIDAYLKDKSPDAFVKLVKRLLASPRYGEQQARHWLDVVRYADTSGRSNDYERPNAWRYRDYIIRSFNADKPYDRFITEQLAGDELEPGNPEMQIAIGFLRMGPWEHTAMTVAAVTRQDFLDDITHNVGVSLLGQALRCARCHDHKFDPVPTKDYYRMQAVFAPAQFAERAVPFLLSENTAHFAEERVVTEGRLQETKDGLAQLKEKTDAAVAALLKKRGVEKLDDLPEKERPNLQSFGLNKDELTMCKMYQKRAEYFERELKRYEPFAFSVYSGAPNNYTSVKAINPMPAKRDGIIPVVHILPGGSIETPTDAVTPGVLSAMAGSGAIPETTEGRRLALAKWIASPDNTLTARVIVNRVWQQHFGRGLVATPNNFGKMGARPTHPELFDWLATWFIENGWSLKKLHALIMSSAAYQQSGAHPDIEKLRAADAKNGLLAYYPPRRLAAEEIRDAMLSVTGELNLEMGGPGVFPEINWEVALQPRHIMGSVAPAYQPSLTPAQRNRRTIYAFRFRTLADPMLEVFNRPGSEISCELRDETTVTPQVFALFNGEPANDRALALAARLHKGGGSLSDRIARAFRLVLGRAPRTDELAVCAAHVKKMTAYHRQHPAVKMELPAVVKRKMVEEMTGEEVAWDEKLDFVANYQRDLKAWDAIPETRALADVCLVLMNSNEFLYIR